MVTFHNCILSQLALLGVIVSSKLESLIQGTRRLSLKMSGGDEQKPDALY